MLVSVPALAMMAVPIGAGAARAGGLPALWALRTIWLRFVAW